MVYLEFGLAIPKSGGEKNYVRPLDAALKLARTNLSKTKIPDHMRLHGCDRMSREFRRKLHCVWQVYRHGGGKS